MKKALQKSNKAGNKHHCSICGREISEQERLCQENAFDYSIGFGSSFDGTYIKFELCNDCFDPIFADVVLKLNKVEVLKDYLDGKPESLIQYKKYAEKIRYKTVVNRIISSDLGDFVCIGKYGEEFICTSLEDNNYCLTCLELNITDLTINRDTLYSLLDFYCNESYDVSFKNTKRSEIIARAYNLGVLLAKEYKDIKRSKPLISFYENLIKDIFNSANKLNLTDEDFIDLFITEGSTLEDCIKEKDAKKVKEFYEFVKPHLNKKQGKYLKDNYLNKCI